MSDTVTINADLDTLRSWVGAVSNEANTMLRMCLDVAKRQARDEVYDSHLRSPGRAVGDHHVRRPMFKRRQSRGRGRRLG